MIPYKTHHHPEQQTIKTNEENKMEEEIIQTNEQPQQQTTEQSDNKDWLKQEVEEVKQSGFDGEILPSLVLEENKITEFEVDVSKPFEKWTSQDGVTKKIIPVTHNNEKKNFWLNVKNPLYSELIQLCAEGKTKFKVMRTGQKQNTKYSVIKE